MATDRSGLELGRLGERAALDRYRSRGFEPLAVNWRCRLGELDLVVSDGRTLVFCEVKARRGAAFGGPFDAVHSLKQRKLRALAQAFLVSEGLDPPAVRFDVASVVVHGSRAQVELFEDAF
jgi:putative endonuclease